MTDTTAPYQTTITEAVAEGASSRLTAQLRDAAGAALAKNAIDSVELTLYYLLNGETINGRDAENIRDENGGAVSSTGVLTLDLGPDDNAILGPEDVEWHGALIEWAYGEGSGRGKLLVVFPVGDLAKVPRAGT